MNPVLPLYYAAPDVEAHVWPQDPGRVYFYCSNDRIDGGGMDPWQNCFSSADLLEWQDHGVAFDARTAVDWTDVRQMPAIDVIEKDGRYFYYFTAPVDGEMMQCVAFSNRPQGPFTGAVPIRGTEFPSCGDPAAFVDDDGQAYLFWGQFSLRGAKLKDNMHELEAGTVNAAVLTEDGHGFHEGASIRKCGSTYYLLYADTDRGRPTCLSYAKASAPLGPYTKGGVIIDNVHCDIASWNNHGSMLCFKNQWYIVYHRATLGLEMGGLRVCIEPIAMDENGDIAEVAMTTQGTEGPIDATNKMDAYRACEYVFAEGWRQNDPGSAFFMKHPPAGWRKTMVENATRNAKDNGVRAAHVVHGDIHHEYLTRFEDGDAAIYRYLSFSGGERQFICEAASYIALTHLELHLDAADGPCIGVCDIGHSGGWGSWKAYGCSIAPTKGVHALYLVARDGGLGSRLCDLNWFQFE